MVPEINYAFKATLVRVVDGDTFEMSVDRAFDDHTLMMVRLCGCDTPEARGPERAAGEFVSKQVEAFFAGKGPITLQSITYRRDMYGRALFRIWAGDEELTPWLLDRGYAWSSDEHGKLLGPRNIDMLKLPQGIKQQVRESMA